MTCKHSNHSKGNTNYIKSMKTLNLWRLPTNRVSKYQQNPLKMSWKNYLNCRNMTGL